jgi:hypothetical protein
LLKDSKACYLSAESPQHATWSYAGAVLIICRKSALQSVKTLICFGMDNVDQSWLLLSSSCRGAPFILVSTCEHDASLIFQGPIQDHTRSEVVWECVQRLPAMCVPVLRRVLILADISGWYESSD